MIILLAIEYGIAAIIAALALFIVAMILVGGAQCIVDEWRRTKRPQAHTDAPTRFSMPTIRKGRVA